MKSINGKHEVAGDVRWNEALQDKILDRHAAASFLEVVPSAIYDKRRRGLKPLVERYGGKVFYALSDLKNSAIKRG